MKKFIIVEICVVVAIAVGFWIGRITSPFNDYAHYYENADKAWANVQQIDNPPISFDEPDKNRLRKVRAAYRAVFDNYPDSRYADDAIYQLASRLPRTDEEGFALFRRLIRDYPDSEYADDSMYAVAFATYEIAQELQESGTLESTTAYYDRALALFNQLISTYPGSVLQEEAQLNAALCYVGRGDVSIAISDLVNLKMELREHPIRYRLYFELGNVYFSQQDYKNAQIEYLNVSDSGDPVYAPRASYYLARVYFAEGHEKETEANFLEIKGETGEAEAMYKEAEAKYNQAIAGYQKVIDEYPDTTSGQEAHFYIAWAYEKTKEYDEAISRLEYAIENYPDNVNTTTAKYYIGQLAEEKEDFSRAIEVYQNFADDPSHDYDSRLQAQYKIGKIYEEIGDIEQASVAYRKLRADFPEPHKLPEHESRKITEHYIQKLESGDVSEEE